MGAEVTHVSSVQHSRKSKQLGSKEDKGSRKDIMGSFRKLRRPELFSITCDLGSS